ncbi:MAG: lipoyl(octanoyl) transferase LipB [Zetaproteobacteria bacterium]|nr:lipoyl(octanoyl) transferase LipB [Zetaproteobacteria bacterium]
MTRFFADFDCEWLGECEYQRATQYMHQVWEQVSQGLSSGKILGFTPTHETIALGKHCSLKEELRMSVDDLQQSGVEVVETQRGGKATVHYPGQLVIYPVLPVNRLGYGCKKFVEVLAEQMLTLLRELGIEAYYDTTYPGVWIGLEKVCAIGVSVRRRVSAYGLALNIAQPSPAFRLIYPCGIQDRGVTYVNRWLTHATQPEAYWTRLTAP